MTSGLNSDTRLDHQLRDKTRLITLKSHTLDLQYLHCKSTEEQHPTQQYLRQRHYQNIQPSNARGVIADAFRRRRRRGRGRNN